MIRAIIIVPVADQAAANRAAKAVSPIGGEHTFTVPLIPETRAPAEPPATHYICNWGMTDAERAALERAMKDEGVWSNAQIREAQVERDDPADSRVRAVDALEAAALKQMKVDEE